MATNTAARPTSEWKAATSCGRAVISILRAVTAPMVPPIAMPMMIRVRESPEIRPGSISVVTMAITMPTMP